ncbi:MAG: hypothetical protein ABSH20_21010 [Tepidisphaeraceae bacterium]|jgi:hypothetical protein
MRLLSLRWTAGLPPSHLASYDHQAGIDAQIDQQARRVETMRAAAGESPLLKHLRATGKFP